MQRFHCTGFLPNGTVNPTHGATVQYCDGYLIYNNKLGGSMVDFDSPKEQFVKSQADNLPNTAANGVHFQTKLITFYALW